MRASSDGSLADVVRRVVVVREQRARPPASPPATASKTVAVCGEVELLREPRDAERPALASTSPASGASSPATIRSSVDLPAPLRPIRQTRSPGSIAKLASSSSGLQAEADRDAIEAEKRHEGARGTLASRSR